MAFSPQRCCRAPGGLTRPPHEAIWTWELHIPTRNRKTPGYETVEESHHKSLCNHQPTALPAGQHIQPHAVVVPCRQTKGHQRVSHAGGPRGTIISPAVFAASSVIAFFSVIPLRITLMRCFHSFVFRHGPKYQLPHDSGSRNLHPQLLCEDPVTKDNLP